MTTLTGPLHITTAEPGHPGVACYSISSHIDADGHRRDIVAQTVRLTPDDAGDLVGKPLVSVEIASRHVSMVNIVTTTWRVTAIGFIEHEAFEALDAAIEELVSGGP